MQNSFREAEDAIESEITEAPKEWIGDSMTHCVIPASLPRAPLFPPLFWLSASVSWVGLPYLTLGAPDLTTFRLQISLKDFLFLAIGTLD